jgi:glycosyltransferase involved in cell wall biosynthesis
MKILQITNSSSLSGGTFQMLELTKKLIKKGYDITIACRPESEIKKKAVELNIKHEEFPLENDMDVSSMYMLYKHLRRERYDIVHAHHPKAHMIAMIASFFARTPVFLISRRVSFSIREGKNRFNPLKYKFFRVNMVLPVCDAIKDQLADEGVKKEKLRTVHSGTDPERFNPETVNSMVREELKIKDDAIVITKIAHYSSWKGYDCFFRAAKHLLAHNKDVRFIIAGKATSSENVFQTLEDMGIKDNFHCLGMRHDIPEILKASDIAVNAAYDGEGLSGSLREALFMGVPIVASDVSGNKEICSSGETGFLFIKNDDAALYNALITLIDNEEMRKSMGAAGREYMLKEFTIDIMAEKTLTVYEELLNKKRLN